MNTCIYLLLSLMIIDNVVTQRCLTLKKRVGMCISVGSCLGKLVAERLILGSKSDTYDLLTAPPCDFDGVSPKVCCEFSGLRNYKNFVSHEKQCGFKISTTQKTKVVGGKRADFGSWPWIAALGYLPAFGNNPYFHCGGSLISRRHVLTAAHCTFERPDLFMVRLSVINLESEDAGPTKAVDCRINKAVVHEEYNYTTFENDIAILKLEKSVEFTDFMHTICLPTNPKISFHITDGTLVHVAGWGMDKEDGDLSTDQLMEVAVPVVSLAECKESLKIIETSKIDSRNICAGYEEGGKDACQGDSGGPLVLYWNDRAYLVGIVSYGHGCARPGYPGVYIRVAYYGEWVYKHMKN